MSNPFQIAGPDRALEIATPEAVATNRLGQMMLRASAYTRPGVEKTSFIDAQGGAFSSVGGATSTVNFQIPIQGGAYSVFDRMDLEFTIRNPQAVPIQVAPLWAWIKKISYTTDSAPLLEQYGESLFALECITPTTLAVQEMQGAGFTATQFSQIPQITPAAGGGIISYPNVLTANTNVTTIAPGALVKMILPISADLFLCSKAYAPGMVNQPIQIRVEFNPGTWWCAQGNNQIVLDLFRLTQCGRIYAPVLDNELARLRRGREIAIPSHYITQEIGSIPGAVAGLRTTFTMQNFTGNYSGVFFYLRDATPNASTNLMQWFWNARPQTYDITTGVLVAGSCGNEYAVSEVQIYPDGTLPLYASSQTAGGARGQGGQLKLLAQESCNNRAYILSEIDALNIFPFSDQLWDDLHLFQRHGAVKCVSSAKFEYVPNTTLPNAVPVVIGWKNIMIVLDKTGALVALDDSRAVM